MNVLVGLKPSPALTALSILRPYPFAPKADLGKFNLFGDHHITLVEK
jgi:hypothetical protein